MKLVSIDIETTGLDPTKHAILEIAAVVFDTNEKEISERSKTGFLNRFRYIVKHDVLPWSEDTLRFHQKNWDHFFGELAGPVEHVTKIYDKLFRFLRMHAVDTAVGKNFAGFDLQFLKQLPGYVPIFSHRSLDLGSMFLSRQDYMIPDLRECLRRANVPYDKNTLHTALADAELVAQACINWFQGNYTT